MSYYNGGNGCYSSSVGELPEVIIYTDGSCSGNPGPGGWGAVLIFGNQRNKELSGHYCETTNNQMELMAAIRALRYLRQKHLVQMYTDSEYVQHGITDWIHKWMQNNWTRGQNQEVKNIHLWKQLYDLIQFHQVSWNWVKGHGQNDLNKTADRLAVEATKNKCFKGNCH